MEIDLDGDRKIELKYSEHTFRQFGNVIIYLSLCFKGYSLKNLYNYVNRYLWRMLVFCHLPLIWLTVSNGSLQDELASSISEEGLSSLTSSVE